MSQIGIINDPSSPRLSINEQFQLIIETAKSHGLNVITVGHECDMDSELMKKLIESNKFIIIGKCAPTRKRERFHAKSCGPRDKWGKAK